MNVALIGCGGIAYHLAEDVARYLATRKDGSNLFLIDGDEITDDNLTRQFFPGVVGWNKADALAQAITSRWGDLVNVFPISDFINSDTLRRHKNEWLKTGVVIFGCLDKNVSRVFVEKQAAILRDVVYIDGGNEEIDGQARLFLRRNGKDVVPKLSEIAPEILKNDGKIPNLKHCLEEAATEPQTALVNKAVATAMMMLFFYQVLPGGKPSANEIRLNIKTGEMKSLLLKSIAQIVKENTHAPSHA